MELDGHPLPLDEREADPLPVGERKVLRHPRPDVVGVVPHGMPVDADLRPGVGGGDAAGVRPHDLVSAILDALDDGRPDLGPGAARDHLFDVDVSDPEGFLPGVPDALRRFGLPFAKHVDGAFHVGLEAEVPETAVDPDDVARLDRVFARERQLLALPDDPGDVGAALAGLEPHVAGPLFHPPVEVGGGGLARYDGVEPLLHPAVGPHQELGEDLRLLGNLEEPEVAHQQFRRDDPRRVLGTDGVLDVFEEPQGEPVGLGQRVGAIDADPLRVPLGDRVTKERRHPLRVISVVGGGVEEVRNDGGVRLLVGTEEELLDAFFLPAVVEEVHPADARVSAADFVVERLLVVLPVHDDPHVDAMGAHRRRERRVELLLHDGALPFPLLVFRGNPVGVVRSRLGQRRSTARKNKQDGPDDGRDGDQFAGSIRNNSFWVGISHFTPSSVIWAVSSKRAYHVFPSHSGTGMLAWNSMETHSFAWSGNRTRSP